MRIAIPVHENNLSAHFGHAETFAFFDIDPDSHSIVSQESVTPPEHQPGVLPRWLVQLGINVVIAGGMGARAREILEENGIEVFVGAPALDAESLVKSYLDKQLVAGNNTCDH